MKGATNAQFKPSTMQGVFTLPNGYFQSGSTGAYFVSNGWCHVRIWGQMPTTTFSDLSLTSSLPPISFYGECKATISNGWDAVIGQIYINENINGHANVKCTVRSVEGVYVSLDYPISDEGGS